MILITSDVHIRTGSGDRTARFVDFVTGTTAGGRTRAIYILGDLFDVWIGPRQARTDAVRDVFGAFREASRRGVAVYFIPGNRDFHLDGRDLTAAGVRRLGDAHEVTTPAGRLLLAHGDQFCTRDWSYRITRAVIRSLPVRAAWRALPASVATDLASGFRSVSRRSIRRKTAPALAIPDGALEGIFRRGADAVVCGHVHRQEHRRVRGVGWEGDLYTLGDWSSGQPHLVVDDRRLFFRDGLTDGS